MNLPRLPTTQIRLPLQALRAKVDRDLRNVLKKKPTSPSELYAQQKARQVDWLIQEQPLRRLPTSLTASITLDLRDEGNALIEETRDLNNRYTGRSYRDVEVLLMLDAEVTDLRDRALEWAGRLADVLQFKLRNRARNDPYAAYMKASDSYLADVDEDIAHGSDRLYALVWSSVMDMLAYRLLNGLLICTGQCYLQHGDDSSHLPTLCGPLAQTDGGHHAAKLMNLYGIEPLQYTENVVLRPLLRRLASDAAPAPAATDAFAAMHGDILEAFPYLLSGRRPMRYAFSIPGTTCVGTMTFVASSGFARFCFSDSSAALEAGLARSFVRGALELAVDGRLSFEMHPWRTLEGVFGHADGLLLSNWLLQQVHHQVVADYLRVNRYYLEGESVSAVDSVREKDDAHESDDSDESLVYVSWVKEAQLAVPNSSEDDHFPADVPAVGQLPQIRRNLFFKLLEGCGVRIEQGKGSEIKLLRDAHHPFRLGNHYGRNPAIPSFLAANILKRLGISGEEWANAVRAL